MKKESSFFAADFLDIIYLPIEMFNPESKKQFIKRIITVAVIALLIFLLQLLSGNPQLVERYYSKGLYPLLCHILHPVFNIFPFSLGDIFYLLLIVFFCYNVIKIIKLLFTKRFLEALLSMLGLTAGVLATVFTFYLFWGMNYFRLSAGERLNLRDTNYSTSALTAVTAMLIDSANTCRSRVTAADLAQSNPMIYQHAINAVSKLSADSLNFRTYSPGVKPSLLTPLLNYISTSGYFNPFTGEAQINYQMPIFNRPVIACHEMSHQMGYGAEDEADFAGFLAAIGSEDRLLRYSAYHLAVDEFMHALRYRDSSAQKALRPRVSAAVRQDFLTERAYWLHYQSKAEVITGIFYDHFLKANNQPQGLQTYNRMVLLVMAIYKNKAGDSP